MRTSNFSLVGSHKLTLASIGKNKFPLEKVQLVQNTLLHTVVACYKNALKINIELFKICSFMILLFLYFIYFNTLLHSLPLYQCVFKETHMHIHTLQNIQHPTVITERGHTAEPSFLVDPSSVGLATVSLESACSLSLTYPHPCVCLF